MAAGASVWVVDADSAVDQGLTAGPLLSLAVSPDGRFVAGFAQSGRLAVWTADFGRTLSEFDTGTAGALGCRPSGVEVPSMACLQQLGLWCRWVERPRY